MHPWCRCINFKISYITIKRQYQASLTPAWHYFKISYITIKLGNLAALVIDAK